MDKISFSGSYHFLQKQQGLFCAYCGKTILSIQEFKKISRLLEGKKGNAIGEILSPYIERFHNSCDAEPLLELLKLSSDSKYQNWSFKNLSMLLKQKNIYSTDAKKTLENLLGPIVSSVEHTTPKSLGGKNSYGNYIPMHRSCNEGRATDSYAKILIDNPDFIANINKSLKQIYSRMMSDKAGITHFGVNIPEDYFSKVTESIANQGIDKKLLFVA